MQAISGSLARWLRLAVRLLRMSRIGQALAGEEVVHPLAGDRCIEWEWVTRHLPAPPARVLDVGYVDSITAGLAAVRRLEVTGVDVRSNPFSIEGLTLVQGSVLEVELDQQGYDCIVLCSTLEHIGLAGRYGETSQSSGDRRTMRRLGQLLRRQGKMIVTVPVGRSANIPPYHRIYGDEDIAILFDPLPILASDYWKKVGTEWRRVPPGVAFETVGSRNFYALGLFVLGTTSK